MIRNQNFVVQSVDQRAQEFGMNVYTIRDLLTQEIRRVTTNQTLQIDRVYFENTNGQFQRVKSILDLDSSNEFSAGLKDSLLLLDDAQTNNLLTIEQVYEYTKQLIQLVIEQEDKHAKLARLTQNMKLALNIEEDKRQNEELSKLNDMFNTSNSLIASWAVEKINELDFVTMHNVFDVKTNIDKIEKLLKSYVGIKKTSTERIGLDWFEGALQELKNFNRKNISGNFSSKESLSGMLDGTKESEEKFKRNYEQLQRMNKITETSEENDVKLDENIEAITAHQEVMKSITDFFDEQLSSEREKEIMEKYADEEVPNISREQRKLNLQKEAVRIQQEMINMQQEDIDNALSTEGTMEIFRQSMNMKEQKEETLSNDRYRTMFTRINPNFPITRKGDVENEH